MLCNLSKDEIKNNLLCETLKVLCGCLNLLGLPLYVVGATARDFAMLLSREARPKRKTDDLDIAIAIPDWNMFDQVQEVLLANHFKKLKPKQKFAYKGVDGKNDYEVDVVPFGEVAEEEIIRWRPDGEPPMSVKCFEDVMGVSIDVCIDNDFCVKMAPLYGQFLIKLDAWFDRRADKDAEDMMYFLKKYYLIAIMTVTENSPVPDVVDQESESFLIPGAQWIAYDVAKVLSTDHLQYYINMISNELLKKSDSLLLSHSMKYSDEKADSAFDIVVKVWSEVVSVFEAELKGRAS